MKKPKCHQEFPIYHPKKKYFISYLMNLLNDFESEKELNSEKEEDPGLVVDSKPNHQTTTENIFETPLKEFETSHKQSNIK